MVMGGLNPLTSTSVLIYAIVHHKVINFRALVITILYQCVRRVSSGKRRIQKVPATIRYQFFAGKRASSSGRSSFYDVLQ